MNSPYRHAQKIMIQQLLMPNRVHHPLVLDAMQRVPRHRFVMRDDRDHAYEDRALALPMGQQIESPLVIAQLLQALRIKKEHSILEVGTGSGYLTALLMTLGQYVFSLERDAALAGQAADRLYQLGYEEVDLHVGDGSQGLADMAPFDRIIVTAATSRVPRPLAMQLAENGRLILPLEDQGKQTWQLLQRRGDKWYRRTLQHANTTRLIGRYGWESANN